MASLKKGFVIIVFAMILIAFSCTDSLQKTTASANQMRIEFSDCSACYECINLFNCPQGAIKIDTAHFAQRAYIDVDLCVQCMDCINIFQCPENAFKLQPDQIPPAGVTNLSGYSNQEGTLSIEFVATGDDSTDGSAYAYDFFLSDTAGEKIVIDFKTPNPFVSGLWEYWPPIDSLPAGEDIVIHLTALDEAGNRSPEIVQQVRILETTPPAEINDLQIGNVSHDELTLFWTAVGDDGMEGTADHYQIKISTEPISQENWHDIAEYPNELVPAPAGEQEEFLISNLLENTAYFAAIKAVDDFDNISELSNLATATTAFIPDFIPPAAISDLTATSPEMNSFVLNWTAVGDDGLAGTAEFYIVKIHTEMIDENNWNSIADYQQNLTPSPAGTTENLVVGGLEPLTGYFAAVKAGDEAGNLAEISNIATAVTTEIPDTTPPAAITDLTAEGFETMIELSWTATGDDGNIGTAFCYEIRYSESEITEANWIDAVLLPDPPIPSLAGTTQSYSAMNLTVGIECYFAIKAFDESDNVSPISNVPNAQLIEDVTAPAAITDLAAEGFETTIELLWTAPGDDGMTGTAESYEIRMHDAEITEANWNAAELLPNPPLPLEAGTIQNYSVQGLNYNLLYFFAIKTYDDNANVSEVSNSPSAQLIEDTIPPADITDLTVFAGYASNLSTIKIEWTAPGDDWSIGTADHYEIRYSQQPITAANWQNANLFPDPPTPLPAGSSQFCNVTGLNAATIYYFAIRAFDDAGNGNNVSNSPAGKIVYQINTAACHNCNNCINDCSVGAIHQGPGYKYINPDQCIACGDCSCPWGLIYMAVVAY